MQEEHATHNFDLDQNAEEFFVQLDLTRCPGLSIDPAQRSSCKENRMMRSWPGLSRRREPNAGKDR
jgi:hypothetical protein